MAIQNNFPNLTPTLLLDFANAGKLDPRVTFSRATTATYFNSLGVLTTANNNVARFDYDPSTLAAQGLLIEEQRTNNTLQSEDFATTWTATGATVSINAATAPSGALTADKLVEDSSTGSHLVTQNITFSAATYTASLFAKKAERDWVRVLFFDGTTTFSAFFNLNTGAVGTVTGAGASASIQNVGNGWYRCFVTAAAAAGSGSFAPRVALADNNSSYTGSTGSGIFIWGAQLEAGAFATSYIPTTTTALTRNADVASMTGTNFSSWYNAVEGTLYVEGVGVNNVGAGTRRYAEINDNTSLERILVGYGFTTACRYLVSDGGATQADIGVNATTGGALVKAAATYKVNDFQQATNGVLGTADTSGTLPTVDRMFIGQAETAAAATTLNGTIRRIAYYAVRATNAQLQALTG